MMDFEKKVKALYPGAEPFMSVLGWGIKAPGYILAIGRFTSASAAWRHAWHCAQAEDNKRSTTDMNTGQQH
jgi:hypothetical protein